MQWLYRDASLAASQKAGLSPVTDARPSVFVVDDDISTRESLEALIELAGWDVRVFDSATAFLSWNPPVAPSCLILDVGLPDLNGLDLQAQIAVERSHLPIIFITGFGDVPTTVRAMKAGAAEFLTKPFGDDVLLDAIERAIEQSRIAVSERSALEGLRQRYASLSRREREVMLLVVSGLLNKQVGGELGISEITVKAHRGRVMDKMKARSLAELVRMSTRLELGRGAEH